MSTKHWKKDQGGYTVHPTLGFYNNDKEFLEKVRGILGVSSNVLVKHRSRGTRRTSYVLFVHDSDSIVSILEQVKGWLVVKRGLAELALEFFRLPHEKFQPYTSAHLDLVDKIRAINAVQGHIRKITPAT